LKGRGNAVAVLLLLVALLLPGLAALRSPAHPAEDAAILMRYVRHLAGGHGMVWNAGDPPADGSTDFLFTVIAAGLVHLGVSLEPTVRILGFMAHALTVLLVFTSVRRLHDAPVPAALLSALFLAWGPGFRYVEMFFGTPLFALLAALAWTLAYRLREEPGSFSLGLAFALASLAAGLARPEGVFLTLFMLIAVVRWAGPRRAWTAVALFAAVFAVLGGAYFFWRWNVFGHPLPTPFYKKGGGTLHWNGLRVSIEGAVRLCLPFLLLAPLSLRSRDSLRRLVFAAIPISGFTFLWVLLSSEMNILHRFQFPLVPLVMISWPDWVRGLQRDMRLPRVSDLPFRGRLSVGMFLAGLASVILILQLAVYRARPGDKDGRYDMAKLLAQYRSRGYTMVTTEAGLLPLYSGWRAVDAWGLNDVEIARNGLSEALLERERPELILFHSFQSPLVPARLGNDDWSMMIRTLETHAQRHGYILAAAFGPTPFETHTYYVRRGSPDTEAIVEGIRAIRYVWYVDHQPTVDYAAWRPAPARAM
jgi:arabinofuranosyltransferase